MSEEKKQLNDEELEKVSGGLDSYECEEGKYYCEISYYYSAYGGLIGKDEYIGPYDTLQQAETAGYEWAVDGRSKGYTGILYRVQKCLLYDWEYYEYHNG